MKTAERVWVWEVIRRDAILDEKHWNTWFQCDSILNVVDMNWLGCDTASELDYLKIKVPSHQKKYKNDLHCSTKWSLLLTNIGRCLFSFRLVSNHSGLCTFYLLKNYYVAPPPPNRLPSKRQFTSTTHYSTLGREYAHETRVFGIASNLDTVLWQSLYW